MMEPAGNKIYTVQKGDSLSKIASRVGVSAREIMELNKIKDANKVRVGQKLILPDYANASSISAPAPKPVVRKESAPKSAPKAAVGAGSVYVVQSGDSLSRIAGKHGVTMSALREANKLKGDKIMIGQKINIPGAKKESASAKSASKAEKAEAAPVAAPAPAAPVTVEVPAPVVAPAPAPASEAVPAPAASVADAAPAPQPAQPALTTQDQPLDYTVQDGDTVENIAKLFIVRKEDIIKLNGMGPDDVVKPGQKIKIPPSNP